MASSPDGVLDDEVRWPLVAWIGLGLAALTVVAAVIAAAVAVFVVDRDAPEPGPEERSALAEPIAGPSGPTSTRPVGRSPG